MAVMLSRRTRAGILAGLLALAAGALTAACTAAGPAAGTSFSVMPLPPGNARPELGPVTGSGTRTFTVPRYALMDYTLGCLGPHLVWLRASNAAFAVRCHHGIYGGEVITARNNASGAVTIRVSTRADTRWELRVTGSGRKPN